ncbi:PP2C family protein-serine/threonine phosphatase [Streptomyces sp. NPDC003697]
MRPGEVEDERPYALEPWDMGEPGNGHGRRRPVDGHAVAHGASASAPGGTSRAAAHGTSGSAPRGTLAVGPDPTAPAVGAHATPRGSSPGARRTQAGAPRAEVGGRSPGDLAPRPGTGDTAAAAAAAVAAAAAPPGAGVRRRTPYPRALAPLLPALLLAVGAVFDWLAPTDVTAAPLLTAAPLVAAPLLSRRATALTGAAAVGVVLTAHLGTSAVWRVGAFTELVTVATVAVLAVLINLLVRRGHERLASAREIAEAAQRAVLPEPAGRIGGLDVAACYEAAQADAFIGGDLYAVQETPFGVRLVVGDVRGKGMGAVAAVAVVLGAFREAAEQEATLEGVAGRLERALAREGARGGGLDTGEDFTTAVLAEIPHDRAMVRIVNRGHPPPLLLHADGTVRPLLADEPALPLGLEDLGSRPCRAEETRFPAGATLLLHTDGLSEARDERGRFYDPEQRLAGRVFRDPDALLATLAAEVRRHTGDGLADDMALLAVRRS